MSPPSLRAECLHVFVWSFSAWEIYLSSLAYLFTQPFISVWTHGYMYYTLGYNPVLLILLVLLIQVALALATGTPVSFSHTANIVFPFGLVWFWALLYFLALQDSPDSSCTIYLLLAGLGLCYGLQALSSWGKWGLPSCCSTRDSHGGGLSYCGAQAPGAWDSVVWRMGLIVSQHVGSSWTRDYTHVPYIGGRILNHWTTREVPHLEYFKYLFP